MASESTEPRRRPFLRLRGRGRPRGRVLRLLAFLGIPLAVAAVAGLLVLTVVYYRVGARFEAREREAPTRIYGRLTMLRPSDAMSAEEVAGRLRRTGYRQLRSTPTAPGEFRSGSTLTIHLRAFAVPGREVSARVVRIAHSGRRIDSIEDVRTGAALREILLEPEVLATLYGPVQEDRTVLPLAEYPRVLVDAVLTAEDQHFYSHPGIDPFGVARAAVANVESRAIRQGGSTLTQQVAKNLFFDQRRTWSRKGAEAVVALVLEARYSKDRILQSYLNEAYLGQRGPVSIKGFAQAAAFYFGKDVRFLDASESATLAGLIRAPGQYNPFVHPDRARQRRDQILGAMEEDGRLTAKERKEAASQPLRLRKDSPARAASRGIHYLADYVRQMIGEEAAGDLSRAGVRVYTTVDPALQRRAEDALARGLDSLERSHRRLRRTDPAHRLQGALVAIDPRSGSVMAIVGGRDYGASQFNRITQARRQPGSLFKPFVFLAGYEAAESGDADEIFTPGTQLLDEPLEMRVGGKTWAPANYDEEFRGPVTAQAALEQSLNVPTVRAAQMIGLANVVDAARRAGVESALKPYPSLALGAQEVTPLEIAAAYATIANGGIRHQPELVEAVEDGSGGLTYTRRASERRAVSEQAAYLVTAGLQGALDHGTAASARSLGFSGTGAGKTGTTDDYRDAWFAGYTPDLLALVWVGFDNGDSVGLSGAQAALPIWADFMKGASLRPDEPFREPPGVVWEQVDPTSGGRARFSCPDPRYMAFLEGTEPTHKCDLHGWFGWWRDKEEQASVE